MATFPQFEIDKTSFLIFFEACYKKKKAQGQAKGVGIKKISPPLLRRSLLIIS